MDRLVWLATLVACGTDRRAVPDPAPPPSTPVQPDPRFVPAIAAAAPAYQRWGRVDDRIEVAPAPCSAGNFEPPGRVHLSSAPESMHDRKLYYLWATDRDAYKSKQPIETGFTIVKESFRAIALAEDEGTMGAGPTTEVDGIRYKAGEPTGQFVMHKVGDRQGADAGWIYGTIIGGKVTSAGRVGSCAGCHEGAPHERLFGLKPGR